MKIVWYLIHSMCVFLLQSMSYVRRSNDAAGDHDFVEFGPATKNDQSSYVVPVGNKFGMSLGANSYLPLEEKNCLIEQSRRE